MITINLVCVGNLKEKFVQEHEKEYLKRLSAFCKFNLVEIKERNALANKDLILQKEGEDILQKLKGHCILCDVSSNQKTSEEFSKSLQDLSQKTSVITFVIGGSYGVSESVRKACAEKISFSKMTFPHNLFRVMLLEQIYRAFAISSGKTYHK